MKRRLAIQALIGAPALTALPLPAQTPQTEIPKLATATSDAVGDAVLRYFSAPQLAALRKLGELMLPAAPGRASAGDAKAPEPMIRTSWSVFMLTRMITRSDTSKCPCRMRGAPRRPAPQRTRAS